MERIQADDMLSYNLKAWKIIINVNYDWKKESNLQQNIDTCGQSNNLLNKVQSKCHSPALTPSAYAGK